MTHDLVTPPSPVLSSSPRRLELNNFTFTPLGRKAPALASVSIRIEPGQRVLLTGVSGSGKSTLLKALAGLIPPDGTEEASPTAGVTLMVQNPLHAFVGAGAGLDIAFAPENAGLPRAQIAEAVHNSRVLSQFTPALDSDPFDLSGGQQQRLSLAGVLACNAGALLLDEPLTMLDPETGVSVREAILQAAGERTLVVADHAAHSWLPHVDRVIEVRTGGTLVELPPSDWDKIMPPLTTGSTTQHCSPNNATSPLLVVPPLSTFHGRELLATPVGFKAHAGELIAITGVSGVGKSTFLRHALESSRDTSQKGKPYGAAWLPQNPETSFVSTRVCEEVETGALSPKIAHDALRAVGVAHLANANPFAISGGEQRRTAFAAALATGRNVLVLDEPTVGLDTASFDRVMGLIAEAKARGIAVIAATHDPRLEALAHRTVRLIPHAERTDLNSQPPRDHRTPQGELASSVPPVPRLPRSVPTDSLNQLTLIAVAICAFVGSFAVHSVPVGLVAFTVTLFLIPLTVRTRTRLAMRIVPVTVASLMIAWSVFLLSGNPWTEQKTWALAISEGLRIFAMVAPGALMLESVEPTRLGQALAQHCALPGRAAAAAIAGLSRLEHMFTEWNAIIFTRAVRGIHQRQPFKLYAGATFALLVSTLRSAEVQALAMDARGFAHATKRTWVHTSHFTRHDLWGFGIAVLVLVTPIAATFLL